MLRHLMTGEQQQKADFMMDYILGRANGKVGSLDGVSTARGASAAYEKMMDILEGADVYVDPPPEAEQQGQREGYQGEDGGAVFVGGGGDEARGEEVEEG